VLTALPRPIAGSRPDGRFAGCTPVAVALGLGFERFERKVTMTRWLVLALSLIVSLALPVSMAAQAKNMHTSGTVKTVSDTSLTITALDGKEMTFGMDSSTKFKGKGLGTKSQTGKLTPSTATAVGDRVTVDYQDNAGTLHAAMVQVTSKALVTKK
jgi:predicted MarR family transcription regulator